MNIVQFLMLSVFLSLGLNLVTAALIIVAVILIAILIKKFNVFYKEDPMDFKHKCEELSKEDADEDSY